MNEGDEKGWSDVHHCAFRGYIKSLERFVKDDPEALELQTHDDQANTPFLLAVSSGNQDTVDRLISLGAKVDAINSQNHGAVEICSMKQYISLLRYFLYLQLNRLPVWKNLLKMLSSDTEEDVQQAGTCLRTLTERADGVISPNWEAFYSHGGVPVIAKVVKSTLAEDCKVPAIQCLLNILDRAEVQEQLVSSGGLPAFVKLLKSNNNFVVQLSASVIKVLLTENSDYAEQAVQNSAIQGLQRVLQAVHDPEVLVPAVEAMTSVATSGSKFAATIGSTTGCIGSIVGVFNITNSPDLLLALTRCVAAIAAGSRENQTAFANEGATQHIFNVILTQARHREVQESGVEAIYRLAENNTRVQRDFLDRGAERLLLQLLKRRSAESLQEKTAMALWALAGDDVNEKREMADGIGVQALIDFLSSSSSSLHLIGSEGLGVLAQGPKSQQSQIAAASGIQPLVRLLKAEDEEIVLSVVRSLRRLCVGVGNVPHHKNQAAISASRGVRLLVALLVHSLAEEVQVEAAYTLGCISLGNNDTTEEIHSYKDFSYVRILLMMYAADSNVRLLAGAALAAFAYNSIQQQRQIADQGGVRFGCFLPFLRSDNEEHRCHAAYQVVVLARIIPDEEQAISSAVGINLLVDILHESHNDNVLASAADYLACLAHTRAGVPSAIVSVNAVDYLCDMLVSESEHVRGNAAIALGYLSFNHAGERQLLHRCRNDPYLMQVMKFYTKRDRLSPSFVEGWKHYQRVGLPPIAEGRPSLVRARPPREDLLPAAMLSLEDAHSGSGHLRATSHLSEDGQGTTGRSSRASTQSRGSRLSGVAHPARASRQSTLTVQATQLSLETQRTQASLQDLVLVEEG